MQIGLYHNNQIKEINNFLSISYYNSAVKIKPLTWVVVEAINITVVAKVFNMV